MTSFKDFTNGLKKIFEDERPDIRAFHALCDQWLICDASPGHFTENDLVDILSLDLDWDRFPISLAEPHPLTHLLMNLPFGQPIPVEPRAAQALSERFGTVKALEYLYHPQALAGPYIDMFDSLHAMCARRAVMAILMPGGVEHIVNRHLKKLNQPGKSFLHLPSSPDASVMGLLSALVPDELDEALKKAGCKDCAYALFSTQRHFVMGDDFYERGMRYVLSRTDSAALLNRFVSVSLGLDKDSKGFAKVTEPLMATVLLAALHHSEAEKIATTMYKSITLKRWRLVVDELIKEQANRWDFDVTAAIAGLEKSNPLRKSVSNQSLLKPTVIRYVSMPYMPRQSVSVISGLRALRNHNKDEAGIFMSLMSQSLCAGKGIDSDAALNLLTVFDPLPVDQNILASLCESRNVMERAMARILANTQGSRQSDSAVSLLARLIELDVYSQAKVYKQIKQPYVYQQFMRDPRHDMKEVLKYCGQQVTRDLLYQAMNL